MGLSKQELLRFVDGLPAFPSCVFPILKLTSDINSTPKELVRVIERDPNLTRKLLQQINAPLCGVAHPIRSLRQAAVIVGINTVKNLALTLAPLELFGQDLESTPFFDGQITHALVVGLISQNLARRIGQNAVTSVNFFVAGLLHDFGKIVLHRANPEAHSQALEMANRERIPLQVAERSCLQLDHLEVGALLAKKWCLPPECAASMASHHDPEGPHTPLLDCVQAANLIAKTLRLGDSGNPLLEPSLPEAMARRLKGTLPELLHGLGELPAELYRLRLFLLDQHFVSPDPACEPP
ncbi:MAG: HDOD domain-containing protein [Magnetococcus sp. YQC-9]